MGLARMSETVLLRGRLSVRQELGVGLLCRQADMAGLKHSAADHWKILKESQRAPNLLFRTFGDGQS